MTLGDSNSERNAEICRRFDAGETMQAIGLSLGITRERVRQIINKHGLVPARARIKSRHMEIAETVAREKLSSQQAAARFGARRATVTTICKRQGVKVFIPHIWDAPEYAVMAENVRNGMSLRMAAGGVHSVEAALARYCQKLGIPTDRHGRWRDFSSRYETIRAMRAAGKTWGEIAEHEGVSDVHGWATGNMPDLVGARAPRKRDTKPKYKFHPPIAVLMADTPKQAALINYGKAPASAIGRAHGVSRNVIIGHWNRLRKAGLLPPIEREAA